MSLLSVISMYLCFDSIYQNILVSKGQYYGVQGISLDLLKKLLFGRNHYVDLGNINADIHEVRCGIPLGSVMGPLLFNIFTYDIVEVRKVSFRSYMPTAPHSYEHLKKIKRP